MMSIAAGISSQGKKVFAYSIANFSTFRALEQLRLDIAYHKLNVCVVGVGTGFQYGSAGYSHWAIEDLAIVSGLEKFRIFSPSDANSTQEAIIDFLKNGKKNQMGIYDNKKLLIIGDYNFYGIYQPYTNLWIWASSIPGVDKKHIKNIQKIKASNYLFEEDSDPKISFYYQLLTQDVIMVKNEIQIQWINELLLYLSNSLFYFNPINSDENMQFLTLNNIKEQYI